MSLTRATSSKGHEFPSSETLQQQQPMRGELLAMRSGIRPLRSWSSSENRAPTIEDSEDREVRDVRRFSVAGPASSAGSTGGSRKSHAQRSLHTWAEEEDEMLDGARAASQANRAMAARLASGAGGPGHGFQQQQQLGPVNSYNRASGSYQSRPTPKQAGGSISSGSMYAKRVIPDGMSGFPDAGSSSSSSGPPSMMQGAFGNIYNSSSSSSSSGSGKHKRLRTPYSISIPSLVGSPLSFTQSFLASRTSMYAKHPPSSQIRAAQIDWDSLSMMEEVAGWGSSSKGAKGGGQYPGIYRAHMLSSASGGLSFFHHQQQHLQQQLQQQHLQHFYGQNALATHPAQLVPPLLQQQSRQQYPPSAAHPSQQQCTQQAAGAELAATSAHAAELEDTYAAMAMADAWGKQAAWDYVCHHHPLLASFSVASENRLAVRWRWCLLCIVAASTVCVLIGTPVALTVLLG